MKDVRKDMVQYAAFKQVIACPMKWADARDSYYVKLSREPSVDADGYLVQYRDGYLSWCPKAKFEFANVANGKFSFAHAMQILRTYTGARAWLTSWNGVGMYAYYADSFVYQGATLRGCFVLVRPNGTHQSGWIPSTYNMTTDEWFVEL